MSNLPQAARSRHAKRPEPVVIATAMDDAFAMPLAVMLFSALTNLAPERDATIYIVHSGVRPENQRKVEQVIKHTGRAVQLHWMHSELAELADLKVVKWHTSMAYLRLRLPDLLPSDLESVIYLDSDVVVECDLVALWDLPLNDHLALGVQNFDAPHVGDPGAIPVPARELGLDPALPYCNNGVMVINVRRWRDERMIEQVAAFTKRFSEHIGASDQDGTNGAIRGDWGLLDAHWNVQLLTLRTYGLHQPISDKDREALWARLLHNARILHYTGRRKPWHYIYLRAGGARFLHYLGRSGWLSPVQFVPFALSRCLIWTSISAARQARNSLRALTRTRWRSAGHKSPA